MAIENLDEGELTFDRIVRYRAEVRNMGTEEIIARLIKLGYDEDKIGGRLGETLSENKIKQRVKMAWLRLRRRDEKQLIVDSIKEKILSDELKHKTDYSNKINLWLVRVGEHVKKRLEERQGMITKLELIDASVDTIGEIEEKEIRRTAETKNAPSRIVEIIKNIIIFKARPGIPIIILLKVTNGIAPFSSRIYSVRDGKSKLIGKRDYNIQLNEEFEFQISELLKEGTYDYIVLARSITKNREGVYSGIKEGGKADSILRIIIIVEKPAPPQPPAPTPAGPESPPLPPSGEVLSMEEIDKLFRATEEGTVTPPLQPSATAISPELEQLKEKEIQAVEIIKQQLDLIERAVRGEGAPKVREEHRPISPHPSAPASDEDVIPITLKEVQMADLSSDSSNRVSVKIINPVEDTHYIWTSIKDLKALAEGPGSEEINQQKDFKFCWIISQGSQNQQIDTNRIATSSLWEISNKFKEGEAELQVYVTQWDEPIENAIAVGKKVIYLKLPQEIGEHKLVISKPSPNSTLLIGQEIEDMDVGVTGNLADRISSKEIEYLRFGWYVIKGGIKKLINFSRELKIPISFRTIPVEFNDGPGKLRVELVDMSRNKIIGAAEIYIKLKK